MSPRYYKAMENSEDDDGLYIFRPDGNTSLPYSELAKVEAKEGNFSSMFHLTYLAKGEDQGNLTVTVELNSLDESLRFDVDLMEITIDPQLSQKGLDPKGY